MTGVRVGIGSGSRVGLLVRGVVGGVVGTGRGSPVGLLVRGVVGALVVIITIGFSLGGLI
jgi:hypothetical protein